MIRLNPQQVQNKSVTRNLFPPMENYFLDLYTSNDFKTFLETNATTPEGMLLVATHYGVNDKWNSWLGQSFWGDYVRDYFELLKIVKIFSNNNNLWISFVEGLHRHAAIVMCLTCSTFDLQDNKLVHNSLKKRNSDWRECHTTKKLTCLLFRFWIQSSRQNSMLQC